MNDSFRTPLALLLLTVGLAACGGATQGTSSAHQSASETGEPGQGNDDGSAPDQSNVAPPACSAPSITFALQLPSSPQGELSCLGVSQTLPSGWASSWLSITGPGGESLVLDAPCNVVCGGQQANDCYVADCIAEPLPPTSTNPTRTWDGTTYSEGREPASCTTPFICYEAGCAQPGDYVAKMCATPLSTTDASAGICESNQNDAATVCTQVPFHWPPSAAGTTVLGWLEPPPDAG